MVNTFLNISADILIYIVLKNGWTYSRIVTICRYVTLLYRHGYEGCHIWYFCHVYIYIDYLGNLYALNTVLEFHSFCLLIQFEIK